MKFKSIAKKVAKWGVIITSPLWPIWVWAPTDLVETLYPNVRNQQEAYQILEEEKDKLGIKSPIDLRIYENNELREFGSQGYSGKLSKKDGFAIGINRKDLNRIVLRHELYHIFRGDCERAPNEIDETKDDVLEYYRKLRKVNPNSLGPPKYFYLMEPKANIYSITGIKL